MWDAKSARGERMQDLFFNLYSLKASNSYEAVKIDFNGQDSYIYLRYGVVSVFLTWKKVIS